MILINGIILIIIGVLLFELMIFLHELGHILFQRRFFQRSRSFSKITDEGAAWEIAFMLADDLLRPLNAYHNKKLRKYALQCMRSYMTEYNELDDKHE